MKHGKRIVIENEALKRLRNSLRKVFYLYSDDITLPALKEIVEANDVDKQFEIIAKISDILSRSICLCPLCYKIDSDMRYDKLEDSWYCLSCFEIILKYRKLKHSKEINIASF